MYMYVCVYLYLSLSMYIYIYIYRYVYTHMNARKDACIFRKSGFIHKKHPENLLSRF